MQVNLAKELILHMINVNKLRKRTQGAEGEIRAAGGRK